MPRPSERRVPCIRARMAASASTTAAGGTMLPTVWSTAAAVVVDDATANARLRCLMVVAMPRPWVRVEATNGSGATGHPGLRS